jgi:hypothetical protein
LAYLVVLPSWHGECITAPCSLAQSPANAVSQDETAAGIGVGLLVGARVPGLESTDCPQECVAMWNEPKSPKTPVPGTLDDLLNRIVDAIQLTTEQHNRAEKLYREIGAWLAAPGTLLAHAHNGAPDVDQGGGDRVRP